MRLVFSAKWFWKTAAELTAAAINMGLPELPLTWEGWNRWVELVNRESGEEVVDDVGAASHVAQYLWGNAGIFEVNKGRTVLVVESVIPREVSRG